MHARSVVVGCVVFLLAGCGDSTSPLAPRIVGVGAVIAPSPNNNALITQNDATTGCALLPGADATRGFGYQIQFQWPVFYAVGGVSATGYEIYAANLDGSTPIVDAAVSTLSYQSTQCNAFVADNHLQGWHWRVRAQDNQGRYSDWSEWFTFQFKPCRLTDGTPCRTAN